MVLESLAVLWVFSECFGMFPECSLRVLWTISKWYLSAQCTLYSVHCTVYTAQCTVYSVQCTLHSVQCTLCVMDVLWVCSLWPLSDLWVCTAQSLWKFKSICKIRIYEATERMNKYHAKYMHECKIMQNHAKYMHECTNEYIYIMQNICMNCWKRCAKYWMEKYERK